MPDICLTKTHRKYRTLLCICILIYLAAMLVRMIKIVLDPTLTRDGAVYLIWVENWIATGNFYYDFFGRVDPSMPLSPWTIKELIQLGGFDAEIAGRSLSLFFGSMFPVIGFLFTWRLCRSIRIALIAAFLLVFLPELVELSGQPMRDSCYISLCGVLMIVLVEAFRESTVFKWALCGIFLALSVYCRYEAMEFAVIVPLFLAFLWAFKKIKFREMFLDAAVFFLVSALTLVLLALSVGFDFRLIGRLSFFFNRIF